jgi:hypothetical protein
MFTCKDIPEKFERIIHINNHCDCCKEDRIEDDVKSLTAYITFQPVESFSIGQEIEISIGLALCAPDDMFTKKIGVKVSKEDTKPYKYIVHQLVTSEDSDKTAETSIVLMPTGEYKMKKCFTRLPTFVLSITHTPEQKSRWFLNTFDLNHIWRK